MGQAHIQDNIKSSMPKYISPTRIREAENCLRKWALINVYRRPVPRSKALGFGTLVHKMFEDWVDKALIPEEGTLEAQLFWKALPYIPTPFDETALTEYQVEIDGIKGRVDLLWDGVLMDYKTSKNKQWFKTADDLMEDLQANAYGLAVMNLQYTNDLKCRWIYLGKEDIVVEPVDFNLTRTHAQNRWDATIDMRARMQSIVDNPPTNPLSLVGAKDIDYCYAFGGCPFFDLCHEKADLIGDNTMSASMEKFLAQRNKAKTPKPVEVEQNPPPNNAEPEVLEEKAKLEEPKKPRVKRERKTTTKVVEPQVLKIELGVSDELREFLKALVDVVK